MFLKECFRTQGSNIWTRIDEVWKEMMAFVIILPLLDGFHGRHTQCRRLDATWVQNNGISPNVHGYISFLMFAFLDSILLFAVLFIWPKKSQLNGMNVAFKTWVKVWNLKKKSHFVLSRIILNKLQYYWIHFSTTKSLHKGQDAHTRIYYKLPYIIYQTQFDKFERVNVFNPIHVLPWILWKVIGSFRG